MPPLVPAGAALLAVVLAPAAQEVGRLPTPAWVEVLELPEAAGGQASGGVELLLQDAQDDLRGATPVRYRRTVARVAGNAGVDSESRVEIEFDPAAEELALHRVAVHRERATSERLEALEVRVLQREKGLEESLLDGRATALAFLEDVRVGDVVEVAYSLRGRKAVFGERWFDAFPTAWDVELRRLHKRVLVGPGRDLAVRLHAGAPEPERRGAGDALELVWDLRDVPAVSLEENVPAWRDVLPWAQLSDCADWPEVARWGAELFALPADGTPRVRALADELAAASDDPLERTRLALRRVQADVRYLGLLFGEGSHRPSAPEEVLARRYGDCKDKALLLCALLAELGVEARPALVSTRALRAVGRQLPSPGAFDHAVVRAVVEGEDLWLDPTQSSERGPIDEWTLPDYGWALVLDAQRGDLVEVVRECGQVPTVRVDKRYDLRAAGPATLEVCTTYAGARANAVREGLDALGPGELERLCLQYVGEQHPRAVVETAPEVADDPETNRLSVRERYRIPDAWDGATWATLGCVELAGELVWPVAVQREQPFALPHPARYEEHLTVALPGLGAVTPQVTRAGDGAFRFESRATGTRDELRLVATLETLRDHVHARDVPHYADELARAERSLYRELARPATALAGFQAGGLADDPGVAIAMGQALAGLGFLLLVVVLAVQRIRQAQRGDAHLHLVTGDPHETIAETYIEGRTLILPRGAELPARCIACAGPSEMRRTVRVQWHSPWMYVLVPMGLLLYFVAVSIAAQRDTLRVPYCSRHDRRRRLARGSTLAGMLLGFAFLLAAIEGPGMLAPVGLVMLLVGAVAWTQVGSALRATYMDARTLHLRGFGGAYLQLLESSTNVGNVPEERSASSTALRSPA